MSEKRRRTSRSPALLDHGTVRQKSLGRSKKNGSDAGEGCCLHRVSQMKLSITSYSDQLTKKVCSKKRRYGKHRGCFQKRDLCFAKGNFSCKSMRQEEVEQLR